MYVYALHMMHYLGPGEAKIAVEEEQARAEQGYNGEHSEEATNKKQESL